MNKGNYIVTVWSGGTAVKTYHVKNGSVEADAGEDGWWFRLNGKLICVSGTITIEEQ